MAKPRTQQDALDDETRVDPFRTDEDTGGDAAPPLRPRDQDIGQPRREDVRKPTKDKA